jgi:hypothetical protein
MFERAGTTGTFGSEIPWDWGMTLPSRSPEIVAAFIHRLLDVSALGVFIAFSYV